MDVKFTGKRKIRGEKVSGFIVQAKDHIMLIIFVGIFIAGLILGSLCVKINSGLTEQIVSSFDTYLSVIKTQSVVENIANQFVLCQALLVALFLFGLCAIGAPIVTLIPLIKGIGIGAISAYLYKTHGFAGFGYCMLLIYPMQLLQSICMIMASNESFLTSQSIYQCVRYGRADISKDGDFRMYLFRYLVFAVVCTVSAVISGIGNTYLSNIFQF